MGVPRYTTPTFQLVFSEKDLDFTQVDHVYVTVQAGQTTITKHDSELYIEPKKISIYFTQEETSKFPVGFVKIQANWTIGNNRFASSVVDVEINTQLLKEVVE